MDIFESFKELQPGCGVYALINGIEVVYIGKSKNAHSRVYCHRKDKEFDRVVFLEVAESDLDRVEGELIAQYRPKYNKVIPLMGPSTSGRIQRVRVSKKPSRLSPMEEEDRRRFTPEYFNNLLRSEGHGGNCDCMFCEGDNDPNRTVWVRDHDWLENKLRQNLAFKETKKQLTETGSTGNTKPA